MGLDCKGAATAEFIVGSWRKDDDGKAAITVDSYLIIFWGDVQPSIFFIFLSFQPLLSKIYFTLINAGVHICKVHLHTALLFDFPALMSLSLCSNPHLLQTVLNYIKLWAHC